MLNHVITTADKYEETEIKDGLLSTKETEGETKLIQRIVALGPNCCDGLNVGDLVYINPMNYARPVHSLRENSVLERDKDEVQMVINWPTIEIDDRECLFIYDRDIDLIVDEFQPEDGD